MLIYCTKKKTKKLENIIKKENDCLERKYGQEDLILILHAL